VTGPGNHGDSADANLGKLNYFSTEIGFLYIGLETGCAKSLQTLGSGAKRPLVQRVLKIQCVLL
jgi:hypothetical protein